MKSKTEVSKIKNTQDKNHFVSIEKLHHFRCSTCDKWWSIGDFDKKIKELFCPWCGIKSKVKK